jgi:hypothetical protein
MRRFRTFRPRCTVMRGLVSDLRPVGRPSRRRGGRRGWGGRGIGSRDGRLKAGSGVGGGSIVGSVGSSRGGATVCCCGALSATPPPQASWHAHALGPGLMPAPAGAAGPARPADRRRARLRANARGARARGRGGGGPLSEVRASLRQRHMSIRVFRSPTRCRRFGRACRRWREGSVACALALWRAWSPVALAAGGRYACLGGQGRLLRRSVGACGSARKPLAALGLPAGAALRVRFACLLRGRSSARTAANE